MKFEVDRDAVAEAEEAARWYSRIDSALGSDFSLAVAEVFGVIRENPHRYGVFAESTPRVPMRAGPTRRFPYLVVYYVTEELVRVVAVMHASRRPGYWRERVE